MWAGSVYGLCLFTDIGKCLDVSGVNMWLSVFVHTIWKIIWGEGDNKVPSNDSNLINDFGICQ
jgi:hypothetical protein